MNRTGRTILFKVLKGLERLRDPIMDRKTALEILKDSQDKVEKCMDEEELSIDSVPENLQFSSRAETMREIHSDLIDANGDLECIILDCKTKDSFSYPSIESDLLKAIRAIKFAIYRK